MVFSVTFLRNLLLSGFLLLLTTPAPVLGWNTWESWSVCSTLCGTGSQYRTRTCSSSCSTGSSSETQTCNTATCPTNQLLTDHRGPWTLVYKAPSQTTSPTTSVYAHFLATGPLHDNTVSVMRDFSAGGSIYKSSKLDNWGSTVTVSAVRLSAYTSGAEQKYVVFNAFGKTRSTFMDCTEIIDSSWTDISSETRNYCTLTSGDSNSRNFFINRAYSGCTGDTGWFMFKDHDATTECAVTDSKTNLPYVMYTTGTTYKTWYNNFVKGDAMAIFVLEWHMVFKGIQGLTPTAGYLELLWEGTSTENDDDLTAKTLTRTANKAYKSKIVEDWPSTFIEQVKYAFFTSGEEKAWVVFDGRGTTKNNWFTDSKVLFSRYTDLTTSMVADSISGDGTRAFALIRTSSTCASLTAWMFSLDNPGGAQSCSFDQNVVTRPYFLYSSGTTYGFSESGGSWNSGSFPSADVMGIFIKGWYPVFKFARGQSVSPGSSVLNLWQGSNVLNDHDSTGQSATSNTINYKSAIVNNWNSYYIKAVKVSFFVSGTERAYIVFDAHGTTRDTWFNCAKILYSSYNDINRDTGTHMCSVTGDSSISRHFFLEESYNGCNSDAGWFMVVERTSGGCSYETKTTVPYPLFSDASGYEVNTDMALADVFMISIDMDNYCDTITCLNGATCYERGVKFECVCDGTYYGTFCADRDGVWTDWTAWATCSTTCYHQGTQSRTRTCTNPSQAGAGTACSGSASESQNCFPSAIICSSYNTGTVAENTAYQMDCPTGYHIIVGSAYYGKTASGCTDTDAVHNLRTHCHAKTTCSFAFSDTYFGDPCSSYTKEGSATLYCRLDATLIAPRGPWRLVFKASHNVAAPSPYSDIVSFFEASGPHNDGSYNTASMRTFTAGSTLYKSSILDGWGTTNTITAIRVSVIKNQAEVQYVIFEGKGKTKSTFWDCAGILESSWIDIMSETKDTCTLNSNNVNKRNFYINNQVSSCSGDMGWLLLKDSGATTSCSYDSTTNSPYIIYSTGDKKTTWASSKEYADTLAIYVLEWHMVLKGIDGLVPGAGSLETLWEGTTTENDGDSSAVTLTTAAAKSYKSAAVEMWSDLLVDQVKLSHFTSGLENAYVVFDGRNTDKNGWFAGSKIAYSSYTDIKTEAKAVGSISGDSTRQFALLRTTGTCSSYTGWMMALDNPSGATTCSWDNNVRTRPYFLYSSGTTYAAPESSSAWNSAGFPYAEVMGIFVKGWFQVFKFSNTQTVSPASGVYDLWSGTYTLNEFEDDSFSMAANSLCYKSSIVDSWSSYYISAVKVSFYSSGTEQAYIVYDGHGTTKDNWMVASRILYTSYSDLHRHSGAVVLGVDGDATYLRRFAAIHDYNDCSASYGWYGVWERGTGCAFETRTTSPYPVYSDAGEAEDLDNMAIAEVFSISVALEDYEPCSSSPCQNTPTDCYNRGPRFVCNCSDTYYGLTCDRRDGAWTDWADWSTCTTTCYAYGTQTRTRTCTNPTKVGSGIDCPSVSSETQACTGPTPKCPVYNSGTMGEGTTYYMICPTGSHIRVSAATYYYGGCSQADAKYKIRALCQGLSSCNITFNDATFGTTCSAYATSGTATMYCDEHLMHSNLDRGPWRLVFRVPSGGGAPTGYTDAFALYNGTGSLNDDIASTSDFSSSSVYYKSSILDEWGTNKSFPAARLSVFKSNKEVQFIEFDTSGRTKYDWMDCNNVIDSSYDDVIHENQSICSFSTEDTWKRTFFLSKSEVDCNTAQGWFFMKDFGATSGCTNYDPTSTSMPFILYSTDKYYVTWNTGNKAYGDVLALFVRDMDMVFKGVSGVTPAAGTLQGLWDGTTYENDADTSVTTVTASPSQTYKDKVVEDWAGINTDVVRLAYFQNGLEVAWVRFDGQGTTKSTWMADGKIFNSMYSDLATGATVTCGISGDGTRKFAIIGTAGTCAAHKAWMMTSDVGSATTCSWDNNVVTKPYFLYSAGSTIAFCETGGSYSSASFPTAQVMGIFVQGWFPVFKLVKSKAITGTVTNVYDMWTNTYTENEFETNSFSMSDLTTNYKSSIIDNWSSHYIMAIKISFYVNGIEVAFIVFDGHATDKATWQDCDRILYSSWLDLTREVSPNICSLIGENSYRRRFYANYESLSCTVNYGWFGVIDNTAASCSTWEQKVTRPYALYSDATTFELNSDMAVADVFTVSVALDNYCDSSPCQNNATCYDRHGKFECVCNGTFYGMVCEHRDGNWTEWSDWATCSTTCWALGSHSRTRTCTNPFPVGTKGVDCSAIDSGQASETKECIPDLPVCELYSTGTITETDSPNTYSMVCPTTHFTMVKTAAYGHASCSDTTALKDLRFLCDGKINCSVPFTDATFGDPCPSSSNYGSATLKCVKHLKLTTHRGPWHLAFKIASATTATGYSDISSFYADSATINSDDIPSLTDFSSGGNLVKSSFLEEWGTNRSVSAVRLSVIKSNVEVHYINFDVKGKNKSDWLNCSNIIDTSWLDLDKITPDICTLTFTDTNKRSFYIAENDTDCATASGWLVVKDYGATTGCSSWDSTGTTMPYILYSGDKRAVTWSSGNKQQADALVMYIMEWDMVFKGTQSVVPTAASNLQTLWTNNVQENDNDASYVTLTTSPNKPFKSLIVDQWYQYNIEMVKYAYFTDGLEVASITFDGRDTYKDTWMADSKILYSSYSDAASLTADVCSIAGDGTRAFAAIYETNTTDCGGVKAWMMALDDASGATTCSFDNTGTSRPYFLYSDGSAWSYPEISSAWASSSFPAAQVMGVFIKGWFPIMKHAHGQSLTPATGIYNLYTGTHGGINEFEYDALTYNASSPTYRSSYIDNWSSLNPLGVKVSFHKNGAEAAFVVFDARGATKDTWMDCNRILYTSYDNLIRDLTPEFCSITGNSGSGRYFYAAYDQTDCTNTYGWFGVAEGSGCPFDALATQPYAMYSDAAGYELISGFAVADVFAISIALDDYCASAPCQMNSTCYNRETMFECICNGTFYGMVCEHRDGNWTEWTDWATCSTTCWALGSHSRTRNCTNPFPVGTKGIDCSGIDGGHDTETKSCIPDLPICPSYSTGNIYETDNPNTYLMTCPTTHFTMVDSAAYGHASCSEPSATKTARFNCDGNINCTITFNDAYFGTTCNTASNYGSATLYCVQHMKRTEHRGPWRLAFRASSGTGPPAGYSDIASFYGGSDSLNEDDLTVLHDYSSSSALFKSSIWEDWGTNKNKSVSAIKVSVIKSNVEVAYLIFDVRLKNKTDWWDCDNLIDSSWVDVEKMSNDVCRISDTSTNKRSFYVSHNDTECTNSIGWLVFKDYGATSGCSEWDTTANTMPYIMFANSKMAVNWTSGVNVATADTIAIYVMEWDMVFKGVEGQTPSSAATLKALWTGATQENDNDASYVNLVTTPSNPFKSLIVDQWEAYNIEFVKYAYFVSGNEVSYVIFDGRETTKLTWFDSLKLLYSQYTNIDTLTKDVTSISGDGTRAFALIYETNTTCEYISAWMLMREADGSASTCAFDNIAKTKPYFLYSNNTNNTFDYPGSNSVWYESSFPAAEVMGVFIKGWFLVMKASHGQSLSPATGIYDLWNTAHGGINEFEYDALTPNASSPTYRSSMIDNMASYYWNAIRVGVYQNGVEKAFFVFDAHNTDKTTWFDSRRLLYTSYDKLNRIINPSTFSIVGDAGNNRRFMAVYSLSGCTDSYGWMGVVEANNGCVFEQLVTPPPYAFFSDDTGYELLQNTVAADSFTISVAMDDYCASAPCQMNSTCYNRETTFECICNGTFYGMVCEHRDGNWTEWSDWATCSTTCWALGSHTRTRTCTNPFPVGTKGIDCSGIDGGHFNETKECIPDLPVCPSCNSTVVYETDSPNTYRMVCPTTHVSMVLSAFYGHDSCSDPHAAKTLRWLCDGHINCTVPFTDATFGSTCAHASNYGYAVIQCVQNLMPNEHRGPWRLVFKVPSGASITGYNDVYSMYAAAGSINDDNVAAMTDFSSGGLIYKSSWLDEWGVNRTISAVKLAVYKANVEVQSIEYDAMGETRFSWMNCSKIYDSTFVDVEKYENDVCGLQYTSDATHKRNFYVSLNETGCANATGWLVLKDKGATDGCTEWDTTSNTMPYILYSTDTKVTRWSDGMKDTADALAIFVMEWDMVFKGVQGETSGAGSLHSLWTGSYTENENEEDMMTITKDPSKIFKSAIVELWSQQNIEQLKFSFFHDGHEVAYVVFDGRDTDKLQWFTGSRILYSNYKYITTLTKETCSIDGDGTRRFAIIQDSGSSTCSAYKAWMMVFDNSGATTCSWDNTGTTRPYFLYSQNGNDTWSYPEDGGSWNSAHFPAAEVMAIFIKGWFPIMKYAHGQPFGHDNVTSVLDLWNDNYPVNEFDYDALNYNSSSKTYRNSLIDTWSSHNIKALKASFHINGVEKAYIVFDGWGSNKYNWWSCDRILYTSYDNLNRRINPAFCSIAGDAAEFRHFYVEYESVDCTNAYGWVGVIEKASGGCAWEQLTTLPYPLISDHTGYELNSNMVVADVFAISVALDNYCDSNPCMNNATCYNRETRYECICNGTFYGMNCEHRDGNWTTWGDWATCSTTCWALGDHTRIRTCSEPTTVGDGIYCDGVHDQTKLCIPDLTACPSYDTGNVTNGTTYYMVCPKTHFVVVDEGTYGNDSMDATVYGSLAYDYFWTVGNDTFNETRYNTTSYTFQCQIDNIVHTLRTFCYRKINCTITFGDALLGDPCPNSFKTGYAKLQCIEHSILTEFRGPWKLAFKVASGTTVPGHSDMASLYNSATSYNDEDDSAMTDFSAGSKAFKSKLIDEWNTKSTINAVKLAVFKNNKEVHNIIFTGWKQDKNTWFNCDNILDSTWYDVHSWNNTNFCNFVGLESTYKRNFFVSHNDTDCSSGEGWLFVKDVGASAGCDWDLPGASTLPYIKYAPSAVKTNWTQGEYADAIGIFVMDWYMAFKAIQGVSPSDAESIDVLWSGTGYENEYDFTARTVTKAPNMRVKDKVIEWFDDWSFIELAKFSFITGGVEQAYILFDNRGNTHKDQFFNESRILFSSYSDIHNYGMSNFRPEGDGTRTFIAANDTSSCSAFEGWMFILDEVHGPTTCSFDNNVVSRPYFLHSNTENINFPESGGSWNSASFPAADVMAIFLKGWFPVMSVVPGQDIGNATSIRDLWTGTWTLDEWDWDGIKYTSTKTFRHSMVDNWTNQYIMAIRVQIFESNVERAYVVFEGAGSNKLDWFDCKRILYSSYYDLTRDINAKYCSIDGDLENGRHFFIEYDYNNCSDYGFFGVIENSTECNYTTMRTPPYIIYSPSDAYEYNHKMRVADKLQVSVALRGYCESSPCLNGASCFDRGARFECVCEGTYYGMVCENRDGNWTEWTPWDTCTTTCYAVGTQERYRNCTNPTTVGPLGIYCPNEDWQIQDCIPSFAICPEYNTGKRNDSWVMVCPWDHYISVDSTWYGSVWNGTEQCSDANAQTTLHGQCQSTVNCTIDFNSWFDSSGCGSYAPYGEAKLYCARDGQWQTWEAWTWCPVTCAGGTRTRLRRCTNPTQVLPGLYCPEHADEDKPCLTDPCPVCGDHWSGYDEPYNVSVFDDLSKTSYGYLMLDVNWEIHCCEVVSAFEFVPKTDGVIIFFTWRKQSNMKYEVINKANYTVTAAEVGTTVNFTFALKFRLAVLTNDVVGWYSSGAAMIGYAPCDGELCPILTRRMSMSEPEIGDIVDWSSSTKRANKAYALRIYYHPNTEPFVNQTEFKALASDSSPIGTSIIAYYIQDDDIGDPLTHVFNDSNAKFELNLTFDYDIHVQSTGPLPSSYTVYELILVSYDTCQHTTTTTLEVTTYNAPPVLHNLPNRIELSEATVTAMKIYDVDAKDYSENDSVCCTLAQVVPGSLNFELKFINQVYSLWTSEEPIFDYSGISNYYKLWVCCSDTWGVTANFLEIDIENVVDKSNYVPPTWFLTAIGASMVPVGITFLTACAVLCSTFFCDAEIEYYYE